MSDQHLPDECLAALECKALKVKKLMACDGCIPDSVMRADLTDTAYLAIFGVLDLVAEVRRLRDTSSVSTDSLLSGKAGDVIRGHNR